MSPRLHGCPGQCGAQVTYSRLACGPCWARLPRHLKQAVTYAYARRATNPAGHREAVRAALVWYVDDAHGQA